MASKPIRRRPTLLASIETKTWADAEALGHAASAGSGLFFVMQSATPPKVGTDVSLALKLPDETLVGLGARVVHSIPSSARERGAAPGFGVRVDASHQAELDLVCAAARHHGDGEAASPADQSNDGYVVLPARVGTGAGFALRTEVAYLLHSDADEEDASDAPLLIEASHPRRKDEASTGVGLPLGRQVGR